MTQQRLEDALRANPEGLMDGVDPEDLIDGAKPRRTLHRG